MNDVTATFDFDPAEHDRAWRAVTNQTSWRYFSWGLAAFVLIIVSCSVIPNWDTVEPLALFMSLLPYLVFLVVWMLLFSYLRRRVARKIPDMDPSARGPQERRLDSVGFHSRGNGVVLQVPWRVFMRAVETEEFFLLFYSKQCAYYVPKRALSFADTADARALLRSNLGDSATFLTT
jgi:hypothetical protein